MRRLCAIPVVLCAGGIADDALAAEPIVADHAVVDRFEHIPDASIAKAAALRLMVRHASVGTTIDSALDCLQGTRTNPDICELFPVVHGALERAHPRPCARKRQGAR